MSKMKEEMLRQVMERAWLIMAFISSALSEHSTVKSNRSYRRLADRSRKALFDLHDCAKTALLEEANVQHAMTDMRQSAKLAKTGADRFGAKVLQRKGTIAPHVRLGFDDPDHLARERRRRRRKREK